MTTPTAPATQPANGWSRRVAGMPLWGWSAIAAATAVVGWIWYKNKSNANANSTTSTTDTTGNNDTETGLGTDQYETIESQIRDLQSGVAAIPTTTKTGATGPTGPEGPPGGPVPIKSTELTTDGKVSMNVLATRYHTSPAAIIADTEAHGSIPNSFKTYIKVAKWSYHLPKGVHLYIPQAK